MFWLHILYKSFYNSINSIIAFFRVFDDLGSSPQTDDANYEERLQSVVVSPHRGHKHRRDSSPEGRKHSKVNCIHRNIRNSAISLI